jgi:orotidine-5'-phosphate decarboxylase
MDDRLIVALDVPNVVQGLDLVARIGPEVSFYKIGLGMLTGGGLALANELKQEQGKRIFLDMKFFDIGATVEAAVRGIAQYDLDFLTVHGDPQVVRAAREGAGGSGLKILAVTVLTSLDRADLDANLIKPGDIAEITLERAARALEAGADGVIASPQEAAAIRALPQAAGRLIVTPGVRPAGAATGDQKRIATPARRSAPGPTISSSAARSGPRPIRPPRPGRSLPNWPELACRAAGVTACAARPRMDRREMTGTDVTTGSTLLKAGMAGDARSYRSVLLAAVTPVVRGNRAGARAARWARQLCARTWCRRCFWPSMRNATPGGRTRPSGPGSMRLRGTRWWMPSAPAAAPSTCRSRISPTSCPPIRERTPPNGATWRS